MKKYKKTLYLVCSLLGVFLIYVGCLLIFGRKDVTEVNKPYNNLLLKQPRLQDDYYDYINFEYLRKNNLNDNEDIWYYMYTGSREKIEEEKMLIISDILKKCDTYSVETINHNICLFYSSYKENNEKNIKSELDYYIKLVNDTKNIKSYIETVLKINKELSLDILVNPVIAFEPSNTKKSYFTLDLITYDFDVYYSEVYSPRGLDSITNKLKRYNVKILTKYGYTENDAYKIIGDIYEMYRDIAKFSLISEKLLDDGYKLYNINKLQDELKVLNINDILNKYSDIYSDDGDVLVADINQLKAIDSYLKEDNLETLKKYAIMKVIGEYSQYINKDFYKIRAEYQEFFWGEYLDFETEDDLIYQQIYSLFKDTITNEFAKRNFTEQEKEMYTQLVLEEINIFSKRIMKEEWLTDETKNAALDKLNKIDYEVGIPEDFVYAERNYDLKSENSYLKNIISMNKIIETEYNRQYKKGNILYGQMDYLVQNAFYVPDTNNIYILLGMIYSYKSSLNLDVNNLEKDYYKLLGTVGMTIGHELTHAFDNNGSKYDGDGNYINWWTEEDAKNFYKLNGQVIKYFDKYEQFAENTLGEDIADLGGMELVMDIAREKNANNDNYKEIFESYALDWCSQLEPAMRIYLLYNDEHSPNKNRTNAILSSTDEFYDVYDIRETDKMYVKKADRVVVW